MRVEAAGALPGLPRGWTLEAQLARDGESLAEPELLPFAGGVAEGSVSSPGPHGFAYRLARRRGGELVQGWIPDQPALALEVGERADVQILHVPAPTAELARELLEFIESCE